MVKASKKLPDQIEQAINEIKSFGAVDNAEIIEITEGFVTLKSLWAVVLPNRSIAKGISDTGVLSNEIVYWSIPLSFPNFAPKVYLRKDFPKNLPHLFPYKDGEFTKPCVSEVPLTDLLHSKGFSAILNAINDWLLNAAANTLHSPAQGWEPILRPSGEDMGILYGQINLLREDLQNNNKPASYYAYNYLYGSSSRKIVIGHLKHRSVGFANSDLKTSMFGVYTTEIRSSVGLLLATSDVIDYYDVKEVSNLLDLKQLITTIGMKDSFTSRLKAITNKGWSKYNKSQPEEFIVILAIKRPFNILGLSTNYELLPFRVVVDINSKYQIQDSSKVYPVTFIEQCNPEMLRKVSGVEGLKRSNLSILGCGSLGSKLAIHLARSGQYDFQLIDHDYMAAHNNARHGLILDSSGEVVKSLIYNKAEFLKNEISKLGVEASYIDSDIRLLGSKKGQCIKKDTDYVIDCTASLPVRYHLSHTNTVSQARLIQTALYGKSKMGVVAIEGKDRSVRVDDIIAYLEMLSINSDQIKIYLFNSDDVDKHEFGEGCSSYTTLMKDTDISFITSGISMQVDKYIEDQADDISGKLIVGLVDSITNNVVWDTYSLPDTKIINRDENNGWEVRIVGDVYENIASQSKLFPGKENGGILIGQTCSFSKTIYVTSLIDSPIDSVRTKDRFDLPVEKIIPLVKSISEKTNNKISFLGTWHSHTASEPPSELDKDTLEKLVSVSAEPVIMLVYIDGKLVPVPDRKRSLPKGKGYV